jgi:glycosyltransferase involved in cell wall biosynthesis
VGGRPRQTRPGRPLRVVHCPVNTAGIPWTNVEALRRRGVDARLVVFERYRLHPEADESLDLAGRGLARRQLAQWRAFARLLPRADVFHFYFGLTLVPKSVQFALLHAARRKAVVHWLGSDIRGKPRAELEWAAQADAEVVGSYDAIRWVPEADVIPPGVDLASFEPAPPTRDRPLVVHAPSSRRRKGTEHVIAACEGLDADLELVEGLHHEEAARRYREADIVVDQLNAGWYGVFAIEAMALGKPVVTFLHGEAVRRTEEAFGVRVPIVDANAETLRERLEELVAAGPAGRRRLGAESRAYVERVHDLERVADRLLDLYARL